MNESTYEELLITNQRLNRRCQRLEHLVLKYRRRYASVRKVFAKETDNCSRLGKLLNEIYNREHGRCWRACFLCRIKWWFKVCIYNW